MKIFIFHVIALELSVTALLGFQIHQHLVHSKFSKGVKVKLVTCSGCTQIPYDSWGRLQQSLLDRYLRKMRHGQKSNRSIIQHHCELSSFVLCLPHDEIKLSLVLNMLLFFFFFFCNELNDHSNNIQKNSWSWN